MAYNQGWHRILVMESIEVILRRIRLFGIGFFELCIIAVVALIFVGPNKLPELFRDMGKFFVTMRRASNEIRHSIEISSTEEAPQSKVIKEEKECVEHTGDVSAKKQPEKTSSSYGI